MMRRRTSRRLLWTCWRMHTRLEIKRKEYKELCKKIESLEQYFDELNASHESLREDHEMLGKAHSSRNSRRKKPRRSK
jgi:Asp-tRNA(Asn)/Glu-tRNA(Gln) amidotransferase C subunit